MQELMIFEGHEVEVFELNGQALFNPYHVGECLELGESAVRMAIAKMNRKQAVKVKNSDVKDIDFRKLNNAGENFLTESGVYKLVFKSHKPNAEAFTDWIADDVLPTLRQTGSYEMPKKEKSTSPKRLPLSSVNMMVKNVMSTLEKAKVEPVYEMCIRDRLKTVRQEETRFKKQELLQAECYQGKRDLVSALLEDGREYSLSEVDAAIEKFMKGKVR